MDYENGVEYGAVIDGFWKDILKDIQRNGFWKWSW